MNHNKKFGAVIQPRKNVIRFVNVNLGASWRQALLSKREIFLLYTRRDKNVFGRFFARSINKEMKK